MTDSVSVSQLMNGSDFLDLSAMDAIVCDENGVNSNSQNVKRSRRNIKKKEYSEGACNDTNDISLSEDDDVADTFFSPKGISDSISDSDSEGENPYVPRKKAKIEVNSATILQSTPKRRGPGRPPGAKNKKGPGAKNKKGKGSKKQTSSRKQGKAKGKKGDTNVVDDKENIPSEELIDNYRIYGKSKGETGCNSPVKKKTNVKAK